jgi:hypothetical protein
VYADRAITAKVKNEKLMSTRGRPNTVMTNTSVSGVLRTTLT